MGEVPEEVTLLDDMQMELGQGSGKVDVGTDISNGKWLSDLLANLRKFS